MIYKIKNQLLEVINECKEYDEFIFKRFGQFETIYGKIANNYLKFNTDSVEINLMGIRKILKNRIIKTDIYPIINNTIAYLINDENNMLIHSIVVSKQGKGVLIVGEFGQGKSTLAKEFENNGYEINSTDQTWLEFKNGMIYQKLGSSFDIEDGKIRILEKDKNLKNIKIEKIVRIIGLCDNGNASININDNQYYIMKNLSPFCYWNYMMPIFTDDIELYNTNIFTKKFLKKIIETGIINIDVRGDKVKILKELGEISNDRRNNFF